MFVSKRLNVIEQILMRTSSVCPSVCLQLVVSMDKVEDLQVEPESEGVTEERLRLDSIRRGDLLNVASGCVCCVFAEGSPDREHDGMFSAPAQTWTATKPQRS